MIFPTTRDGRSALELILPFSDKNDRVSLAVFESITHLVKEAIEDQRARTAERIWRLVVAVNGSSINVGKSQVTFRLSQALNRIGLSTGIASGTNDFDRAVHNLPCCMRVNGNTEGILLFEAEMGWCAQSAEEASAFRQRQNERMTQLSRGACTGINLWVAVETPERPFQFPYVLADVLIHNEGASEK